MKKCLAFFLAAFLGVTSGVLAASVFQITRVSDSTMLPTFEEGEHLLVIKAFGGASAADRGDVILLENQVYAGTGEDSVMMKRIIAAGGDRVAITDGEVYVNGKAVDESEYVLAKGTSGEMTEKKIRSDEVFVLGDNRANSTDSRSRTVGIVKRENLLGKVIYKW